MPYHSSGRRPARGTRRAYHATPQRRTGRSNRGNKEYIDPARFIKPARPVTQEAYTPQHRFQDFPLHELLQANITAKGFVAPSPIQDQAVPAGLGGQDIIGIANTGTGKTLAFALPVLHKLITDPSAKAIIMAPTRELATQIEDECRAIAKGSGLYGALLIGGASMGQQLNDLRYNPTIIIGTPGRIKDHMERGSLDLSDFNIVVLDEVDRMLDMGFINDMQIILGATAPARQSFFFSATMDPKVRNLIYAEANDPTTISVKTGETTDNVHQDVIRYRSREERIEHLHDLLLNNTETIKALVFDETQRSVEKLSRELVSRGFPADVIHGGKTQSQRQRALDRFKKNDVTILVATDVAARGIDVADVTHVINYSTPQTYDDYVHRIGRAGRAGRTGYALTFIES